MAKTTTRQVALPWTPLARALTSTQRRASQAQLRGLLDWQRALGAWPRLASTPRAATPFVSLYERGRLLGCFGSDEGGPGERVARAFLMSLHDPRVGGSLLVDRAQVSAELTYLSEVHALPTRDLPRALDEIEVGTHGLAWVAPERARSALLLPQVARDHGYTAEALLDALCKKASVARAELASGRLVRLSAESRVAHAEPVDARGTRTELAAKWLADQIDADGSIAYAVDPRTGTRIDRGLMYHGRAAVLLQALAAWPQHRRRRALAARRLVAELDAATRGRAPLAWPEDEGQVAGTLALAVLAGLPFREQLLARAGARAVRESAWHAAQVVTALGSDAPSELWQRCVGELDQHPWAPWTALAAVVLDDRASYERASHALVAGLSAKAIHRGGVRLRSVPELAVTAITVEALAAGRASAARTAAIVRGRAFLARWQFRPQQISASIDPACAMGAFPLSPVASGLRCDVTAHALLALA